ncbi:MAG: class II fructose-bisphosphate aldolase [Anaerolineae bacterium]
MHDLQQFVEPFQTAIRLTDNRQILVTNQVQLRDRVIDELAVKAALGDRPEAAMARWLIWEVAASLGIFPESIQAVLAARLEDETYRTFTIPALNLRALPYDLAQAVFGAAVQRGASAMIFELARSEIMYTQQSPEEYVAVVLAAAVKTGYSGPVFFQGDHFQVHVDLYRQAPETELETLRSLIQRAVRAGFLSIDVGASGLVDYEQSDLVERFARNGAITAQLVRTVREWEPAGRTVAVGAQVTPPGRPHTTPEDIRAFLRAVEQWLPESMPGLSKLSVQAGTSRGGVVLPDGSVARIDVDFQLLHELSTLVRTAYGMPGVVQYGASTLPVTLLYKFVESEVCEIHLATEFQNILFEHPAFPADLRAAMYAYVDRQFSAFRTPGMTDAQFYYRERKRAIGPFKRELWGLGADVRSHFRAAWQHHVGRVFDQLGVANTVELVTSRLGARPWRRAPEEFQIE